MHKVLSRCFILGVTRYGDVCARRVCGFPFRLSFNLKSQTEITAYADARAMFLLRDALSRERHPAGFLAAQVACAFNDTTACEDKFKKILATQTGPATAKQIHHILASAALRQGRYRRAWQELDALLAIDPNDADARGGCAARAAACSPYRDKLATPVTS